MNMAFLENQSANTSVAVTYGCMRHTIGVDYARGNQHQRTEHASCVYCGAKYRRVTRWAKKTVSLWRAV